jgi:hypothetical protein
MVVNLTMENVQTHRSGNAASREVMREAKRVLAAVRLSDKEVPCGGTRAGCCGHLDSQRMVGRFTSSGGPDQMREEVGLSQGVDGIGGLEPTAAFAQAAHQIGEDITQWTFSHGEIDLPLAVFGSVGGGGAGAS